jgi:L-rhamnonate dehydratase
MQITDVRAVQPDAPGSPPDWRTTLGQILVAVDTDVGLTGYGVGGGGPASVHVIRAVLRDLLLGENPAHVEALWARMYRATLPFGRKGLAIMALSGVDLALWDLRGKAAGRPVAMCLGGEIGRNIPTYTTLLYADLHDALERGQQAFKVHLKSFDAVERPDELVEHVAKVREQIGPGRKLMFDAFMHWDVDTTLRVAEKLVPYNLTWLEEPLPPDDFDGYAQLSRHCPIPIAGGEHEYTATGFAELIERRLHQVLQPDVCWCGGMTELVQIYAMAKAAGLRVCPHRGAEPWALHAIAALDPDPLAESGRQWMTWVGNQPEIRDGTVRLTDAPGFGLSIDESLLA